MENQFQILQPWLPEILSGLKKEIKGEHLAKSPALFRAHFGHRPMNRVTNEEILAIYEKELLNGNEEVAEWIVNRWVFNHGDMYEYFAKCLSQINPDFGSIQELSLEDSEAIIEGAIESLGSVKTYQFSVLNKVVFPSSVLNRLRTAAEKDASKKKEEADGQVTQANLEQLRQKYQSDLEKLSKKHEEKIAGIMKKYTADVEALKKQIRALQSKLNG